MDVELNELAFLFSFSTAGYAIVVHSSLLLQWWHQFPLFHPINPEFRPIVDGEIITDLPSNMFKSGNFQRVPFIIGTVRDEFGKSLWRL